MTGLPALTGNEIVKALVKAGFQTVHSKGSDVKLAHPDGRTTIVPVHKGESIGKGLMSKILRDVDLSKEEFALLLK